MTVTCADEKDFYLEGSTLSFSPVSGGTVRVGYSNADGLDLIREEHPLIGYGIVVLEGIGELVPFWVDAEGDVEHGFSSGVMEFKVKP